MDLQGFDIDVCAVVAPPGLRRIEYAAIDGLEAGAFELAIGDGYNQQYTVQFDDGAWETLPHAPGTADLEENIDPDAQGPLYRVGVSARIGGDSADIRDELNKMKQHRYLLRVTRRDGTVLLLGTPEQPLTFESRFESGSEGSDFRGHRCTFEGVSPILSPHYVPVF